MIQYIFHIGIIYIVFSLIWAFFILLYNMLTNFSSSAGWQTFVMKCCKTYFLISIVAIFTNQYMVLPGHSAPLIATVGLLTLYSYLVGRLQQKRMILQINNRMGNFTNAANADLRLESLLIVLGMAYFTICLYQKTLPINQANLWFFKTVNQIYETPVIGWIIGFFGILFLLSTLLKAILVTANFIANFQDIMSGRNKRNGDDSKGGGRSDDDGFADYEVIE